MRNPAFKSLPLGAVFDTKGTTFRLWAPNCKKVYLKLLQRNRTIPMKKSGEGFFVLRTKEATPNSDYFYQLDEGGLFPDPASRFQPDGPHGPSRVVNSRSFGWTDQHWRGPTLDGAVLYEMHVGAFTKEGTFKAARKNLKRLKELGITIIEIMPLAECPGRWNWGYDGVDFFAPAHMYGTPDDVRHFINDAHSLGIGVIHDVVYNHAGPDGNYLAKFSEYYFSRKYSTDWGDSFNFDGPHCSPVRDFFIANACYWISEFHFDGLRLDATQNIYDESAKHILADISDAVRRVAGPRRVIIIGENEPQEMKCLAATSKGGYGIDALWNDDFHHAAKVALTEFDEAYLMDYRGAAQEFVSLAERCTLFQGQYYRWQKKTRGTPVTDQPARAFVSFLQNHDQVANSATGDRVHSLCSPEAYRAFAAYWLLMPQTPLFFMGQEYGETHPFRFFCDYEGKLAKMVEKGRVGFLSQFPTYAKALKKSGARVVDPRTFMQSKLRDDLAQNQRRLFLFHKELLALRQTDPVISRQDRREIEGVVLADRCWALRFFDPNHGDRLLVVNLGEARPSSAMAEPLLAPPVDRRWKFVWHSNHARYGGKLAHNPVKSGAWDIPKATAFLCELTPKRRVD